MKDLPLSSDLRLPRQVHIGPGSLKKLGEIAPGLGKRALLVTGKDSLRERGRLSAVELSLTRNGVSFVGIATEGEPDFAAVDAAARKGREERCEFVIAIGGGSVLDLGKAAAGMIPNRGRIKDYLEGVGKGAVMKRNPLPSIAIPTTSGTGSEATRNAVISGPGFKKSFRDPRLVPTVAIVDAELSLSCSAELSASCGMDAMTQLVESMTSLKATRMMESLALSGLAALGPGLRTVLENGDDLEARAAVAYGSFISGVTLSHAGLGAVHGLASPLGGMFPVPHATACARLLPLVTEANRVALKANRGFKPALEAYDRAESVLGETIRDYCARFSFPGLSEFGMKAKDIPRVVKAATSGSMKSNPVELTAAELAEILKRGL